MPENDINPYEPPQQVHTPGTVVLLESLLRQSASHRVLLWLFLTTYFTISGFSFFPATKMITVPAFILHMLLMSYTWFLISETYTRPARVVLTLLSAVPVFNLLVLVINYMRITHISTAIGIQNSVMGPVTARIRERIAQLRSED